MKYFLDTGYFGEHAEKKITKKTYDDLVKSKQILTVALSLEEKYEILIQNYLDFENQILLFGSSSIVRNHLKATDFFEMIVTFNRLIVNLLTSSRLYVDQTKKDVTQELFGGKVSKPAINKLFSAEYDQSKEYRFMEQLRNYVQHSGLAVHSTSKGNELHSKGDEKLIEFTIDLFAFKTKLKEGKNFRGAKLDDFDEEIDLKKTIRSYISSLSVVHNGIRQLTEYSTNKARKRIEKFVEKYHPKDEKNWHVSIYGVDEKGNGAIVPIHLDWDDIRIKLRERNKDMINLNDFYVSNIIKR